MFMVNLTEKLVSGLFGTGSGDLSRWAEKRRLWSELEKEHAHIVLKDSQSFAWGQPAADDPSPLKNSYGTNQPP
jgi:hypothetical protein